MGSEVDAPAIGLIIEIAEVSDPLEAASAHRQALRDAYWEQKDLGAVIVLAAAGVAQTLSASEGADDDTAYRLRSEAKAMLYDLASFTWPGWDEPEITIGEREVLIGLQAASADLAFARELEKGDLPISRALWMLGAQQLAARRYPEACEQFGEAADTAERAGVEGEALLAECFGILTRLLGGDVTAEDELAAAVDRLYCCDGGPGLAAQVVAAQSVFS